MSKPLTMDAAVAKYIELRTRRSKLKAEFEEADKALKEIMDGLSAWFLKQLNDSESKGATTNSGTVYKTYKEYVNITDAEQFYAFVVENEAYQLFEKRVSRTVLKEMMEPDVNGVYTKAPPPGLTLVRELTIGVRKA